MTELEHNEVAIVTGANGGLGYEITLALARRGYRVIMACRDTVRAEQVRSRIVAMLPRANVALSALDLSEPSSIRSFGDAFRSTVGRLDLLIHNAGVFGVPLAHNSRGIEMHLATNYLGPFLLTGLLLPYFEANARGRIVCVGSLAHRKGRLDADNLVAGTVRYKPFAAYARSKLALLTYCMELNRRLRGHRSSVVALAAHPGAVRTEIAKTQRVASAKTPVEEWLRARIRARLATTDQAAEPILHAAWAAGVQGGEYFGPGGWFELKGATASARLHPLALDPASARRLWSASEQLTGIQYLPVPQVHQRVDKQMSSLWPR